MIDRAGQMLGNYKLIKLIGRGGFADVYLGEHIHLGTPAAIKVLNSQLDAGDLQSFVNEARTIARLPHSHIVRVLEFGVDSGVTPYLVTEFAPGGTLRQRHPKGQSLLPAIILPYVKQIAGALQYVHNEHLIHLDVKPENMLVGRNNEILLSDFGIAVATKNLSSQYTLGTVSYMAPEQIKHKPCSASDQYSLGVVVYEWLCGNCPFTGHTYQEIADQHVLSTPPPIRTRIPTISLAIEDVVLKALAKDPRQRFSCMLDFASSLEQAYQGIQPVTPVASSPISITPNTIPISSNPGQTVGAPLLTPTVLAIPPIPNIAETTILPPNPPKRKQGDIIHVHRGHTNFVRALTWSPDGTRIASGSDDQQLQIWDATTGNNILIYKDHSDQIWSVTWSPDGKRIASGSVDQYVQVWDATTGKSHFKYHGHYGQEVELGLACAVAWSPDGRYISSGGADWTVQVWNARTGDLLNTYRGHGNDVNAIGWSPDSRIIATASDDKTVRLWEVAMANAISTYENHSKRVRALAWSPNGQHIASASDDTTVQVWDTSPGMKDNIFIYRGHTKRVCAVAWSPDGTHIASSGYDSTVQIWDVATQKRIFTYYGHTGTVNAVAWSPDGIYIASGSDDETVQVWQAT